MEAKQTLDELEQGNLRYRDGLPDWWAAEGEPAHRPIAAVVACSDARVPVEVVFDQPPGALFVVRVAGHVLEPAALASIRFAVESLGVPLVVVLGHTACGAVRASLSPEPPAGLAALVEPIRRRLVQAGLDGHDEARAIRVNAVQTADEVERHLRAVLPSGFALPAVVPAICDVGTGAVEWLG